MKRILKLDNVLTYHLAISDKNSFLNLKIPITKNKLVVGTQAVLESYEKTTFDNVTYRIEKITSTTIDKFIFNEKLKKVDLIKIDTEGAEIAVLKGGLECLKMDKPILIVQLSFLYELGYEAYSFTDTTLRRFDKNSNKHYGNSIFIHKEKSRLVKDGGIK
jgi:FkbM family methyltransferase